MVICAKINALHIWEINNMKIREIEKQDFGYVFIYFYLDSPVKQGNFSMHSFSVCQTGGFDHVLSDSV